MFTISSSSLTSCGFPCWSVVCRSPTPPFTSPILSTACITSLVNAPAYPVSHGACAVALSYVASLVVFIL